MTRRLTPGYYSIYSTCLPTSEIWKNLLAGCLLQIPLLKQLFFVASAGESSAPQRMISWHAERQRHLDGPRRRRRSGRTAWSTSPQCLWSEFTTLFGADETFWGSYGIGDMLKYLFSKCGAEKRGRGNKSFGDRGEGESWVAYPGIRRWIFERELEL